MEKLLEFLAKENNARVIFEDKWMCVTAEKEGNIYAVYQRAIGKRKTTTLYEGHFLTTAVMWLSGEIE